MASYTWDFGSDAEGLKFSIVYDDATGKFTVTVLTGAMNVNALYWGDGDSTAKESTFSGFTGAKSESSLNMNGTGEVFDGGIKISDAGLGKTPPDSYIVAGSGHSSFDIDAAGFDPANFGTLGVRATSTTSAGGSIKWIDDEPTTETPDDHFPVWDTHSISHVTFYFDTPAGFVGDTSGIVGTKGANDPDGWFTVKFDDEANLSDDLDDWFDDALAYIVSKNPTLDTSTLKGVSIKGSTTEIWYDLDNDPNDDDSANAPSIWVAENKEVDQSYTVTGADPFSVVVA